MASIKTLQDLLNQEHISNGDIRYIATSTKNELFDKTNNCAGSLRERLYWLQHNITSYPLCITCYNPLTSRNFKSNFKGGIYTTHCSVSCAKRDIVIIEQQKETIKRKYGSYQYLASADARYKIEKTNIKKYGTKTPSPWGSDSWKNNMINKYGVESSQHIPKSYDINIKSHIVNNIISGKTEASIISCQAQRNTECQNVELAFDLDRDNLENIQLRWKHITCGKEYISRINNGKIVVCPHCKDGASVLELSLRSIIMGLTNDEIVFNDRTILEGNKELDIYIPNKKIAIEFNGIYWHSILRNPDRFYHLSKTEECISKGIKLIHLWEHDFLHKNELIISMLANSLGLSAKLDARKCEIKEVSSKDAIKFTNINHIDGSIRAKINIGLYHNNILVSLMSFGHKRFQRVKQPDNWEIYRFCTLQGFHIRGGASKLFKYFIKTVNPKYITLHPLIFGQMKILLNYYHVL